MLVASPPISLASAALSPLRSLHPPGRASAYVGQCINDMVPRNEAARFPCMSQIVPSRDLQGSGRLRGNIQKSMQGGSRVWPRYRIGSRRERTARRSWSRATPHLHQRSPHQRPLQCWRSADRGTVVKFQVLSKMMAIPKNAAGPYSWWICSCMESGPVPCS